MRWRGERESQNVEDRRDEGGGFGFPMPGGGVSFPSGGGGRGGIGIVGILIILGLMLFFGIDPRVILQGGGGDEDNFPNIQLRSLVPRAPMSRPPARSTKVRRSSIHSRRARTISSNS
jgi:predicted metalloprotease